MATVRLSSKSRLPCGSVALLWQRSWLHDCFGWTPPPPILVALCPSNGAICGEGEAKAQKQTPWRPVGTEAATGCHPR